MLVPIDLQVALRYKPLPLHIKSHGLGVAKSIADDFQSARLGPDWHKLDAVELLYKHWIKSQPCISPRLMKETDEVLREATARVTELRYGITVSRPPHGHATAAHSLGRQRDDDGLATARARQSGLVTPYTPEGRF
ncbi:uncharacterized protein JCM10292_002441 [Rhodotorula paludigena]|uniref:uncharacterized protein n=1 Tax=Rhodotorula paludigena TaxID=86838 RepID=UPI00317474B4